VINASEDDTAREVGVGVVVLALEVGVGLNVAAGVALGVPEGVLVATGVRVGLGVCVGSLVEMSVGLSGTLVQVGEGETDGVAVPVPANTGKVATSATWGVAVGP
jgi:hypothetical protein